MAVGRPSGFPSIATLAPTLVRALPSSSRPLAGLLERLRTHRAAFTLHETSAGGRPFLLAGLYRALRRQLFVAVPTADVAERTFADLSYYLAEDSAYLTLVRPREESVGVIESPSERSARMTLLADLIAGKPLLVVAPLAALRQYVVPRAEFRALSFALEPNAAPGFDALQRRLYELGYHRSDVVAAAGEYAVRGGIVDIWSATAIAPARVEFFGDEIESIRSFDLVTQRSNEVLERLEVVPWSEITREEARRERVLARVEGRAPVVSAARSYLAGGAEIPEAWLPLAYDERETLLDYLAPDALVVLEEPSMLARVESGLDDERSREEQVLLAAVESGELSVDEEAVGEALLAEVAAPHPTLHALRDSFAERSTLVIPGAIEGEPTPWLPRSLESFVLETRPVEHFNRQVSLFLSAAKEWIEAGETVALVSAGASRLAEMLQGAGIAVERRPTLLHLRESGHASFVGQSPGMTRGGVAFVDQGNIETGFAIPGLRLRVLGDREIFGQPPKRVKLRAVKEGVPVTLGDLKVGDYVVHAVHGIGQYLGLRTETILGATSDYLDLKYAGTDRMLVPVTQMHQVTKYGAAEGAAPRLSKMGGADWARTKTTRLGKRSPKSPTDWSRSTQSGNSRRAMRSRPTRRGKPNSKRPSRTIRPSISKRPSTTSNPTWSVRARWTAWSAATSATARPKSRCALPSRPCSTRSQVAVLVPTTLLAAQHYRTFSQRFAGFPVRVEELSRFKTRKEQQAILRDLADGKVDVVVGTHRLLQKDVVFRRARADRRRRGAALRRHAQGAPQADARLGRRHDAVGDADPAHAAHVAAGRARSFADPNAAQEPHVDQDDRRSVLRRDRPESDPARARPRRPGLLPPQPRSNRSTA